MCRPCPCCTLTRCIKRALAVLYLDAVCRAVEQADPTDAGEDGVVTVLQHVVSTDGGLELPLGGEDSSFHHGEIVFIQHLGHIW